jgi:hypothetical protein
VAIADVSEAVRGCYRAYETNDRRLIESLLADEFTFSSPHDPHLDRDAYFERCWPNSRHIETIAIEKLFVQGDEAFVRYRLTNDAGSSWRNAEWLRFDGGKLVEVQVYYGSLPTT